MDKLFVPIPFNKGIREPYAEKVRLDGERMYTHARYVIVLDSLGNVIEAFDNPPFDGIVDCLVVLAPYTYRGVHLEKVLMLEIGFRRFSPYSATEYRPGGIPKRTPRVRGKRKEKVEVIPRHQRGHIVRIPKRSPIAKLSQQVQLRILPKICEGIQRSVYSIIGKWNKGILHQDNYAHDPMKYSYEAHVVIRIPMDEQFLLAAARFSEIELRFSPRKNLHATSVLVKKYCIEFIARNNRSRTVEGDWMEKRIREAPQASCIAELLKPRIQNGMYHEQILSRLLDLVGKTGSQCRIFLDQVFKIYKIPQAVKDVQLTLYENKYGKIKAIMLSLWGLRNFSYTSNRRRTKKHARHAFSLCVLGSHEELKKLMEMRDARENKASKKRIETMVSGMKSKIEEDELDADIPF